VRAAKRSARCGGLALCQPLQFGPRGSSEISRDFDRDRELLEKEAWISVCAGLKEMYPAARSLRYGRGAGGKLAGARVRNISRRNHCGFEALQHVEPNLAFFGQKDAAQAVIVRRMVRDLNIPVQIVTCPPCVSRTGWR